MTTDHHIPSLSVILAFHNAESTLQRALQPFASPALSDVELILVNDGSTDRSLTVACAFLKQHPELERRTTVLSHPFRKGIAEATAAGIGAATGYYVTRCDADDYIEPQGLREAIDAGMKADADMLWSPVIYEQKPGCVRIVCPESTDLNRMKYRTVNFALWNKLIRRSLLTQNNIYPFTGVNCWEDVGMTARVIALDPSIATTVTPYYHYVRGNAGKTLSESRKETLLHDHLRCALYLDEWFTLAGLAEKYRSFLTHLKFVAKIKFLRGKGKNIMLWKSTFPETNADIMSIRQIALPYRLGLWIINRLPVALVQRTADIFDCLYRNQ